MTFLKLKAHQITFKIQFQGLDMWFKSIYTFYSRMDNVTNSSTFRGGAHPNWHFEALFTSFNGVRLF